MTYLAATLAILLFAIGLWLVGIVPVASRIVTNSRQAVNVLQDAALDDEAKEAAIQQASVSLLAGFVSILVRGAIAIALSILPLFVFEWLGLASVAGAIDLLSTWQAILIATVVMTLGYLLVAKR